MVASVDHIQIKEINPLILKNYHYNRKHQRKFETASCISPDRLLNY